jgi:hypothetical protein
MFVVTYLVFVLAALAMDSEERSMAEHIRVAQQRLEEFERTHSLETLNHAVQALEGIEQTEPLQTPPPEVRSRGTLAWVTLFRHIDQYLDPNFDPSDVPSVNVIPPATSKGVKYPSGVDPNAIPDSKARTKYIELLNQNRAKLEHYNFQHRLGLVNQRALEGFHQYTKHSFAPGGAGSAELRRILDGSPLGTARKRELAKRLSP